MKKLTLLIAMTFIVSSAAIKAAKTISVKCPEKKKCSIRWTASEGRKGEINCNAGGNCSATMPDDATAVSE